MKMMDWGKWYRINIPRTDASDPVSDLFKPNLASPDPFEL